MGKKNSMILLLILGTAFWGISFSVTKIAISSGSSSSFLFYRFLGATLVLSLVFAKHLKQLSWHQIKIGMELAVPLTLGIYLQTMGIKYSNASQCAFVAGLSVIIIPLLKIVLYRYLAPLKIWVAALFALTGLFIISIKGDFSVNIGDLYTIAGAFGFAYYLIRVEKHSRDLNIVSTIVPMFATCTLVTLVWALLDVSTVWLPQSENFWWGIGFCALFSTAYMYSISNMAQTYLSAERVAIIYLFEPVFGAIAAYFLLGETLSWRLLLGGSLILVGMLIAEVKIKRTPILIKQAQV